MDDTIAAIATPIGEGGIGIVRLSGPDAGPILRQVFAPARATAPLEPRRLVYGHVVDPVTGERIDEVLAVFMPAPHTYTRQDVAEIQSHGGIVPLQRILALVLREGARLAEPGEFTLRAFLNGRLTLDQAEAVLDIVQARTAAALRVAVDQLGGRLTGPVRQVRTNLIEALAYLTAAIDFPEDEIPPHDLAAALRDARQHITALLATADQGRVYRQGVRTAIVGRPNVGKSSLLNALLRESRAIVTPVPGTTRDTLEEVLNLHGVPFVLVDTAGITQSDDMVEQLGVERSRRAIAQADLVLLVVDGSEPLDDRDQAIAGLVGGRTALLVVNKSDLPAVADLTALTQDENITQTAAALSAAPWGAAAVGRLGEPQSASMSYLRGRETVRLSALTGDGLDALEAAMVEAVLGGQVLASDAALVTNPRHQEALSRAAASLASAERALSEGLPLDCISIDVSDAVAALGEITGETVTEDLLDSIFSRFCLGK
ncbi:MAG: tRNA uridine-5-carboxymethylaminomethyl(34) synthesis GTPase MnmE [Chloroflexi bacterium]|nr:tRNA uridine-5-carboxymethylaminomethyl(34) synthesis GTPase MnmE [Chloroflexota bacterium]MBU1751045.1 tRNA uridine-5-carboxymethylaminomethyl(34) synthesis GTPase MnmE [Chloroflexota bacterium]MBU1877735.1 tRNA uridine-5-carboxymethylaminomethyl(34) synthesis GTPase MnmE [Chloroflexota bacterium]